MRPATAEASRERLGLSGAGVAVDVALADGTVSVARGRSVVVRALSVHAELEDGETSSSAGTPWELIGRPERFEDAHGAGVRALMRSASTGTARRQMCRPDTSHSPA